MEVGVGVMGIGAARIVMDMAITYTAAVGMDGTGDNPIVTLT